jgi:glycosyltransferase involved in cell wall biosynthesis
MSCSVEPIRVTHVITGLAAGGAEMMLLKLLTHSRSGEFRHDVISLLDDRPGPIHTAVERLGIAVQYLGMSWPFPRPSLLVRLARLLAEHKPHIVQGWEVHGNLAATLAKASRHVPGKLVWSVHGSLDTPESERPRTRIIVRCLGMMSRVPYRIVYVSATSARQHEANGYQPSKSVVIPIGFDTDVFKPDARLRSEVRQELQLTQDAVLVGVIARYHPAKDHVNLLDAAALLRPGLGLQFLLVGRGINYCNRELTRRIEERQLTGCVRLLGEREDVPRLMAALDLLVLPSCAEAFPNVVGEAMACGVPCVVTRVGDTEQIVGDTGLVIPSRDPVALASAIRRLAVMSAEERHVLGRGARLRIRSRFLIQDICSQYEDFYRCCVLRSDSLNSRPGESLSRRTACARS